MSDSANDPAKMLAQLFEQGQAMMRQIPHSAEVSGAPDPMAAFMAASKQFTDMQQDFLKQMTGFWSGMAGLAPPANAAAPRAVDTDRRFAGDAWRDDPRFDLIKRTYLSYASFWQQAVESAPTDDATKAKLRYDMRQFIDAVSPANFFATNPEAMQLARETGGQSVAQGMGLFFEDLAKGRISTTDEKAFTVGTNIAATPGAVIYENDLMQLIQYTPLTQKVHARPLVIIPPCINKFYVMDLQPDNSLVRYAVEQGHNVFMVSWRNVDASMGHLAWDDYLEQGVMQAIKVAQAITKSDKVNTLGFCVGGTLLACALAVMKAKGEDVAASMTLLTTMLDFTDTGEIGALVSEESVVKREATIGSGGLMHGKEFAFTFTSLRANDLMWQYVVNNYLKGKAPPAFDMLFWNADSTNLPGPMFCWYLRNAYLENNLREPDKTVQCGVPVDLSLIDAPAFLYASREDHIVPWHTAYASADILSGDVTFVLGASGHIAGVINAPAKNKRNHWIEGSPGPDAERWLSTARNVPGSWWPQWRDWLAKHAGPLTAARTSRGNAKYPIIEPAPGRYVMQKAD